MKVLMVCLGNICRSPMAEGILKREIENQQLPWQVDSAGTSSWHSGELPDSRSIEVCRDNGIDITDQRSRQIVKSDLDEFDLIIAMDSLNFSNIKALASSSNEHKIKLLLNYAHPGENRAVPDPYYSGGFPFVFNMIQEAVLALIKEYL